MGWSPFRKTGLTFHQPAQSVKGYTLVTPIAGDSTYLLNMSGQIVHRWRHPAMRAFYAKLLEDGKLLAMGTDNRPCRPSLDPVIRLPSK